MLEFGLERWFRSEHSREILSTTRSDTVRADGDYEVGEGARECDVVRLGLRFSTDVRKQDIACTYDKQDRSALDQIALEALVHNPFCTGTRVNGRASNFSRHLRVHIQCCQNVVEEDDVRTGINGSGEGQSRLLTTAAESRIQQ